MNEMKKMVITAQKSQKNIQLEEYENVANNGIRSVYLFVSTSSYQINKIKYSIRLHKSKFYYKLTLMPNCTYKTNTCSKSPIGVTRNVASITKNRSCGSMNSFTNAIDLADEKTQFVKSFSIIMSL